MFLETMTGNYNLFSPFISVFLFCFRPNFFRIAQYPPFFIPAFKKAEAHDRKQLEGDNSSGDYSLEEKILELILFEKY